MNSLDATESLVSVISKFAFLPTPQKEITENDYHFYHRALEALKTNEDWLKDAKLVESVISRLWTIEPKNSGEILKTVAILKKIKKFKYIFPSLRENDVFDDFLTEMKNNLISISPSGLVTVILKKYLQEEQWDFLNKLPITEIEFRGYVDLEKLLNFSKLQPNIQYLKLDNFLDYSSDIANDYLEELSKNLLNIKSFSITSKTITTLPERICNRIIKLNCIYCLNLTTIDAPKAIKLNCSSCPLITTINAPHLLELDCTFCPNLTTINAPEVTKLDCSDCPNLTTINAPEVTKLDCSDCPSITTINAPKAIKLNCSSCPSITTINAPKATKLDCSDCPNLTTINAPKATKLDCIDCPNLTTLDAPKATKLDCSDCPNLTTLDAPEATKLDCSNCPNLTTLDAPKATKLDCSNCPNLTTIDAPEAKKLDCSNCPNLTTLDVPKATNLHCSDCSSLTTIKITNAKKLFLRCSNCPTLTNIIVFNVILLRCSLDGKNYFGIKNEVKFNLAKNVYRNIITNLTQTPGNTTYFLKCFNYHVKTELKIKKLDNFLLLNKWFTNIYKFAGSSGFNSNEDAKCIDDFLTELLNLISKEDNFKNIDLEWFQNLKKLNSLQQQMKRIVWLASVFACNNTKKNLFSDKMAVPTLKVIGELTDSFVQQEASRALLSVYDGNSSRYDIWKRMGQKNRKSYLNLLVLILSASEIDIETIEVLLKSLKPNYYQNFKVLNPILEMTCLLFKNKFLKKEDYEKILKLILKLEIPQKPRLTSSKTREELNKQFNLQKNEYKENRKNQEQWVRASRDLLFFERGEELTSIETIEQLLVTHQNFCREFFGIENRFALRFSKIFKSDRYPNGLFTYAARLQRLPFDEKTPLTKVFEKFVNSCLTGEFPSNRYDLSDNPHLKNIFENNPELLKKWREPLEIPLIEGTRQNETSQTPPHVIIRNLMRLAIENGHFEKNKNELSKEFIDVLDKDDFHTLNDTTSITEIEIDCLNALDPNLSSDKRLEVLTILLGKLHESLEFKNDVKGMIEILSSTKTTQSNLKSIISAESWEDFLLMGTEVNNSCQRIDGDPKLNKCLLSYILDGKNKVILVKDAQGKIVARSVLRILWDNAQGCPVLFMERIYTKGANQELFNLIRQGCMAVAKNMKLTLVTGQKDFPNGIPYNGDLFSLKGPVPFEYVDYLRGIQPNGVFEIRNSYIILDCARPIE